MAEERSERFSQVLPVESGSFRVDRKRALDKLMRFQMPDAGMFLLPWVRAATASGASHIWITSDDAGLEFRFDGRPWAVAELSDPYRCLFVDAAEAAALTRNRELAVGILTALRLRPQSIALQFYTPDGVRVLRVDDLQHEVLAELPDLAGVAPRPGEEGVQMRIRVLKGERFAAALEHLETECRRASALIRVDGERLYEEKPPARRDFEKEFSEGACRGAVWLSPRAFASSRIEWDFLGTTVARERLVLPGVQVAAWITHEGLQKTVSQTGVAKDAVYQECLRTLVAQTKSLLERAEAEAEFHASVLFRALQSAKYRREWMPWEEQSTGESVLSGLFDMRQMAEEMLPSRGGEIVSEDRRLRDAVRRSSLAFGAVRAAALLHREDMESREAEALGGGAVLLDARGRPLSLRALQEQRRWLGYVPVIESSPPEPVEGILCAWVPRETDRRFLEDFFPGAVRAGSAATAAKQPARTLPPVLTDSNLLIRLPFARGGGKGEFGLSLSPHPQGSRLRWLRAGRVLGTGVWPLGGLRLECVIDYPSLTAPPNPPGIDGPVMRVMADLLELAPEAYRRLSKEYDCDNPGPRDAMIREHLLDLACASWDGAAQSWKQNEWLDGVALFRESGGRMVSMAVLRAAADGRAPLSLFDIPHPVSQLEMTRGYRKHLPRLFAGSTLIGELISARKEESPASGNGGAAPIVCVRPVPAAPPAAPPAAGSAAANGFTPPSSVAPPMEFQSPAMLLRTVLMAWSREPYGKNISALLLSAARILDRRQSLDAVEASGLVQNLEALEDGGNHRGYLLAAAFSTLRRSAGGILTDADELAFLEALLAEQSQEQ